MRRVVMILAVLASATPAAAQAAPSGNVAALQVALRATGDYRGSVDGVAGPATAAAVASFQRRKGLPVDGIAGPQTRRALGRRGRPSWGSRRLAPGMRGWDVAVLQFKLAQRGFPSGAFDGGFGPRVQAALQRFQSWAGLPTPGVVGPATRVALRRRPPRSPLRFHRPVNGPLGDPFGPRGNRFHSGVDFTVGAGVPTRAAGRGCVKSAGWHAGGYGNLVVLEHRRGVTSWYAHLSSIAVRPGQCVAARALVGRVGSTGRSFGPHAHFELRVRDAVVDPRGAFL